MPNSRPTPDTARRPTTGERNRRYLTTDEVVATVVSPPPAAPVDGNAVGDGSQERLSSPGQAAMPAPAGPSAALVHDELTRAARDGKYSLQDMVARGAESVLYRANAGPAILCAKSIRNVLGLAFNTSGNRSEDGKIDASYHNKVRHLRNEFAVGTALQEPGELPIVRIYALRKVRRFGLEMGYDLLMELVEGTDMGNRQFARDLSVVERLGILYQTVQALHFMHHRGYVHLDMKPSNIMVCNQRVKLIDFGVSVTLGHRPHAVTGTAGYLSPEQIVRDHLNEATDLFALGVTFAVIFGGRPLRQSPAELKSKQFRSEAQYHLGNVDQPAVMEMPDLASFPEIAHLLSQCTVLRRDRRIATSAALLARLEHAAAERGIRLPPARL
jgi:serine/threonine protein kinase